MPTSAGTGRGIPAGLEGDAVPLAVRIAGVARDADLAIGLGERAVGVDAGSEEAGRTTRRWSTPVERVGPDVLSELDGGDEWETALAASRSP